MPLQHSCRREPPVETRSCYTPASALSGSRTREQDARIEWDRISAVADRFAFTSMARGDRFWLMGGISKRLLARRKLTFVGRFVISAPGQEGSMRADLSRDCFRVQTGWRKSTTVADYRHFLRKSLLTGVPMSRAFCSTLWTMVIALILSIPAHAQSSKSKRERAAAQAPQANAPSTSAQSTATKPPTAVGFFGRAGGKLSVTAADGTRYDLDIPKNALPWGERIAMTVVPRVSGLPDYMVEPRGVEFSPSGLQFVRDAWLKIGRAHV